MKRNISYNNLGPVENTQDSVEPSGQDTARTSQEKLGKVRVNEGDAWYTYVYFVLVIFMPLSTLMYSHRSERSKVDVVDLDPYGTAAPFIDAAVQCLNDGGDFISYC